MLPTETKPLVVLGNRLSVGRAALASEACKAATQQVNVQPTRCRIHDTVDLLRWQAARHEKSIPRKRPTRFCLGSSCISAASDGCIQHRWKGRQGLPAGKLRTRRHSSAAPQTLRRPIGCRVRTGLPGQYSRPWLRWFRGPGETVILPNSTRLATRQFQLLANFADYVSRGNYANSVPAEARLPLRGLYLHQLIHHA